MTKEELRAVLDELGWTQVDLSRRLGVHRKTVGTWTNGLAIVPGYAIAYLRLVIGLVRLTGEVMA